MSYLLDHLDAALILGAFSVLTMAGSMFLALKVALIVPPDYFKNESAPNPGERSDEKNGGVAGKIVKNVVGVVLILAGIAMLVLPGQGILTIFAGLVVMDFPGKYRMERKIASLPLVLKAVNAIRIKAGREPIEPPIDNST